MTHNANHGNTKSNLTGSSHQCITSKKVILTPSMGIVVHKKIKTSYVLREFYFFLFRTSGVIPVRCTYHLNIVKTVNLFWERLLWISYRCKINFSTCTICVTYFQDIQIFWFSANNVKD